MTKAPEGTTPSCRTVRLGILCLPGLTSASMTSVMYRGVSRGIRTYCSRSGRDSSRSFLACFTQLMTASKTGSSESTYQCTITGLCSANRLTSSESSQTCLSLPVPVPRHHYLTSSRKSWVLRKTSFHTQVPKTRKKMMVKCLRRRVPRKPSATAGVSFRMSSTREPPLVILELSGAWGGSAADSKLALRERPLPRAVDALRLLHITMGPAPGHLL